MEKRRVKKPRGLKWLLASYFLQTAVDCVVLLLVWWMGMGFFIRFLVYPANAAQQAARASSQAILENGTFLPELVDPLCRYIVFGPEGEVLQTDMSAGEQEQAQSNYRGDSMQNGFFYPKFYAHSRLENGQTVLLQYDFRQQYRSPALRGLPDFQTCYLLALALVGLFTVFLHTWLFARRLEKAIRKLAQAGGAIAAGELEQGDFSSTGVKELDGAMAAMDTLRKSLAASLKEQWALRRQRQAQVAALAHDLKTPLAVISGNTELLLEEPAGQDGGRKELETILRSARRANDYLAQLVGKAPPGGAFAAAGGTGGDGKGAVRPKGRAVLPGPAAGGTDCGRGGRPAAGADKPFGQRRPLCAPGRAGGADRAAGTGRRGL